MRNTICNADSANTANGAIRKWPCGRKSCLQDRRAELEDLVLEVTKVRQDQPDNQDPVGRGLYIERSKKSNMIGDKVRMLGNCYVVRHDHLSK